MLKLIIFDFGGVLGSDADEWETTFKKIPETTGLTPQRIEEIFNRHWPLLKIGQEPMTAFWQEIATEAKNKVDPEKLRKIYNANVTVNMKMLDLAKKLKRKSRIVILMNESDDGGRAKIEKFKLDQIFDKVYNTADMGVAKPDPKAFTVVIKEQGIKPKETLFIDNLDRNCQVATSLGINSILFKSPGQLKKELSTLLTY